MEIETEGNKQQPTKREQENKNEKENKKKKNKQTGRKNIHREQEGITYFGVSSFYFSLF